MDPRLLEPSEIAKYVWQNKYAWYENGIAREQNLTQTLDRVARALAQNESDDSRWYEAFLNALQNFQFLPGGRIFANAGTHHRATLFNCFVMGTIDDSMTGIFEGLKEGAMTMQQGGGVGFDFSTLRPHGAIAHTTGTVASGPVSFMKIWNAMCATILSTGSRRGAMMATLRCDHPDIEEFIESKRGTQELKHFNLSVLVTDRFMQAVSNNENWNLIFPESHLDHHSTSGLSTIMAAWPGFSQPVPCKILKQIPARVLWDKIMQNTYEHSEPGVLFIDRIQEMNNLKYRESIFATNPCGEIPLPPYGACNLGSINLTQFVLRPFTEKAQIDWDKLREIVPVAVRMLDNVIDVSHYPLAQQKQMAQGTRRLGLGITGLADALAMLGIAYNESRARHMSAKMMELICHTAYETSIQLAQEKGAFPYFEKNAYLASSFVQQLPSHLVAQIQKVGIRNSHLIAIAPAGTISLLASNVSSGIEPIFGYDFSHRVLQLDGRFKDMQVTDYAVRLWRTMHGQTPLPPSFMTATEISPFDHLEMQAALQPFVDNSISKTINVAVEFPFEQFRSIYLRAYEHGLKGCTTFRPNPHTGVVLSPGTACGTDKECD